MDNLGKKPAPAQVEKLEYSAADMASAAAGGWRDGQRAAAEAARSAPAGEREALMPTPDEIHQMTFEEGQPAENGDGYLFCAEEFDCFVQRLLDSIAAPAQGQQVECQECERKQREIDLLWSDRRKDADLIHQLRTDLAYFPPTVRQLAETCAELRAELAELSALKAQQVGQELINRDAIHLAFEHKLREVNLPKYGEHKGDWRSLHKEEMVDVVAGLLATPQPAPAQDVAGWIPMTERLPEVAQEVIVSTEFEGVCAGILDSYGEWFAPCSEYKLTRVTHWMPLPAAPAHDKQSGGE